MCAGQTVAIGWSNAMRLSGQVRAITQLGRKNISKLRCMFVKDTNTTKKPEPKIDSAFQAITAVVRMLGGSENASY